MSNPEKIAVVTGANRGLGLATVRELAKKGIRVILTSRDPEKGKIVTQSLESEGLEVTYHSLDITDSNSIETLAEYIKNQFGRLDILVNNAGIFIDPMNDSSVFKAKLDTLKTTMETNLYGPFQMSLALIPLMKIHNYGRIVNVSSGMGQLSDMGGGDPGYRMSKTALNALTRILANELKDTNILVNSVCPGWVRTDMGGPNATRSIEEGIDTIVWLATLPDGSSSGGFFRDRLSIPW